MTFNSSLHTCAFEKVNQKQRELYNMKTLLNDSNAMSIPAEGEKTNWRGKYAKEYNTETFENGKYIKSGHERRKREVDPTKVTCELYMQVNCVKLSILNKSENATLSLLVKMAEEHFLLFQFLFCEEV